MAVIIFIRAYILLPVNTPWQMEFGPNPIDIYTGSFNKTE